MAIQIFPEPTVTSGDPASKTFPATAAATYTMGYTLTPGVYEITTDTSQSSHTITFEAADGYRFSGTVRGGKGYVSIPYDVTKIIIPSGLTYPINYNIRLGGYTQIAVCSATTSSFTAGNAASFTFTAPAGATNITAFWKDGTNTSFATTSSPKTSVTIPGVAHNSAGTGMLVATDANGIYGAGVLVTTNNTANIPISGGQNVNVYTSGSTTYLSNEFTASGTLVVSVSKNIDYLVVAGGGGGGNTGGGGAGGMKSGTLTSVATGSYTVTVGGGGAGYTGSPETKGSNGSNSVLSTPSSVTSTGGGGGGSYNGVNHTYTPGASGGSGGAGGMGYNGNAGDLVGGNGTSGEGNNGGNGQNFGYGNWNGAGGGGGGKAAAGANATAGVSGDGGGGNGSGRPGAGGNGDTNSLKTGSNITYAGGGGGGGSSNPTYRNAAGGSGGGATGGTSTINGSNGSSNTGGGGGGGKGAGGSGVIIVRVAL